MSSVITKFHIRSFAISAVTGIGVCIAMLCSSATQVKAADAEWCLYQDGYKDCAYHTWSQCHASASGQGGQCDVNTGYPYGRSYAQYGTPRPVVVR